MLICKPGLFDYLSAEDPYISRLAEELRYYAGDYSADAFDRPGSRKWRSNGDDDDDDWDEDDWDDEDHGNGEDDDYDEYYEDDR
jgi:hypothetical protein